MGEQIAIVGAGISGLIACKYCLSKGFKPLVFESQSCIGGAWTKTFETTKLQTPKSLYQFSDFPWPSSSTEEFPDQHHVLDYVQSYAHQLDLVKHIKFDSKVVSIEFEGSSDDEMQSWSLWNGNGLPFSPQGKWKVMVEDLQNNSTEVYQVDFVILCVGRLSGVPNIPEFPPSKGPEAFHGKVIHSMDYAAMDYESAAKFVKGKRVTVVGFQKSALDIAMECSAANGVKIPCTILYKTEHWNVPDHLPWGLPMAFLYLNRFSELLLHKPGEGILLSLLATLLSPLRWGISKFVETYIKKKHPLAKYGMIPKHSFLQDISSCLVSTVPEKFYEKVEKPVSLCEMQFAYL
ncbi:probable flavin-containing monooxygenase 1 [Pistacia vera]|uniref:probable flavin-containing monooxygenase 1 n=1 Tax=Pistacia vera TaxID=55513 RepID=UPI001263E375|nr:probable flavin-containing monooxygenase 1 [Pistacia vera]